MSHPDSPVQSGTWWLDPKFHIPPLVRDDIREAADHVHNAHVAWRKVWLEQLTRVATAVGFKEPQEKAELLAREIQLMGISSQDWTEAIERAVTIVALRTMVTAAQLKLIEMTSAPRSEVEDG